MLQMPQWGLVNRFASEGNRNISCCKKKLVMATPYLGEIRIFSFGFPPKGWAFCNGQTLPINQNQALFAILGTMYGGNGVTTFLLPNLQTRVPIHRGAGFVQGQVGGETAHTLLTSEIAAHNHTLAGVATGSGQRSLSGNLLASPAFNLYGSGVGGFLDGNALTAAGGGQPHNNLQPYLVLSICMALVGVFPSRN
jgi:microcystin-dependent protein